IAFGVGLQQGYGYPLHIFKNRTFSPAIHQSIFGGSLFPESIPVDNLSICIERQHRGSEMWHCTFWNFWMSKNHCVRLCIGSQRRGGHLESGWRRFKSVSQWIWSKGTSNPHPHVIGWSFPVIFNTDMNFWCPLPHESDLGRGHTYIGSQFSYGSILHTFYDSVGLLSSILHFRDLIPHGLKLPFNGSESLTCERSSRYANKYQRDCADDISPIPLVFTRHGSK